MLIDYTRIQNPKLLNKYNKLTYFEVVLNIPKLIKKIQNSMKIYEDKCYGVLKHCNDYSELNKLSFFLLMMKESEGIKIESEDLDFYKVELLSNEQDFSKYSFYLKTLLDEAFSEQLFNKLLIDHKYLFQIKKD